MLLCMPLELEKRYMPSIFFLDAMNLCRTMTVSCKLKFMMFGEVLVRNKRKRKERRNSVAKSFAKGWS
jgi:hypothetical protein